MRWVSAAAGTMIVGAALFDIGLTVLHTQKESRISAAFNRLVWACLRGLAGIVPRRYYHSVLAWAVPIMIGGLIGLWVALFILGYALMYLPWIHDPGHFAGQNDSGSALVAALYHSGISLSTVGYGDIVPRSAPFRLLAVTEGLSGLVLITLSVTYLLTLYPALSRKNVFASALNEETDGRPDAAPMVARYLLTGNFEPLAARLTVLNEQLLAVAEAHRFHSVLYYSHPVEVERSLVRALLALRGLLSTIRFGLYHPDAGPERSYWNDPRVLILENSFTYTLRTLATSIHVRIAEEVRDDDENRAYLGDRYARLRAELFALGLLPSEEDGVAEDFATFRVRSDNYINAYRKHAGYRSGEIEDEIKPARLL